MFEITKNCQIQRKILFHVYNVILGGKTDGTFVEVGAFDGVNYSNTYGLLKSGWLGLLIEPDPSSIEKLKYNLKELNYKLFPFAASNKSGQIKLYQNEEFSSAVPNKVLGIGSKKFKRDNFTLVETKTLDQILVGIETYDLLNLDVEGYEIEVLKGYDISKHNPKVAIVETHDKNPKCKDGIKEFCDIYFLKNKYKKWFSDKINTIYIK